MKHDIEWSEEIYAEFCRAAMLSELDRKILRLRIMDETIQYQALEAHIGTATVSRHVRSMQRKYDAVQKRSSILPERQPRKRKKAA